MKIIELAQGSPEWLAHRRTTRNASESPALMGRSPYMTRTQMLLKAATGIEKEVDAATQRRFDKGHQIEPELRILAEGIIGEELYPITAVSDDGYLGASFDGVTLSGEIIFEAKQTNAEKIEQMVNGVPAVDYWQVVHQFAVNQDAKHCIYMVGNGIEEETSWIRVFRSEIEADIPKLIAAWQQFDKDVAAYQPEQLVEAVSGEAPQSLPAIRLELTGMVTASNLPEFKEKALAVFQSINQELVTDQDFANAEEAVKFCGDIESKIEAAKQHALSQTASIDELFRVLDEIKETARRKRLDLDKLVKTRKESRKAELVNNAVMALEAHAVALEQALPYPLQWNGRSFVTGFNDAIKGRRSLVSMKDGLDTVLAQQKIELNALAEKVRVNDAVIQGSGKPELFPDASSLVLQKSTEDLKNLVAARLDEQEKREAKRRENEEAGKLKEAEKPAELPTPAPQPQPTQQAVSVVSEAPTAQQRAPLKLGQINELIAPLKISEEGLAKLGFHPVGNERAAKLYEASKFPAICEAMKDVLISAAAKVV